MLIRWNENDGLLKPINDYYRGALESGSSDYLWSFDVDATIDGVKEMIEKIKIIAQRNFHLEQLALVLKGY